MVALSYEDSWHHFNVWLLVSICIHQKQRLNLSFLCLLSYILRQLAVGFSRPQPQSLVAWLRELHRDRLRQLVNPACGRSSALFLVLFMYACHSIYCLQLVHSLSATVGSKISPPSWWSEAFWGFQNITSLPPPNIIIDTLVFRFSKSKIADLKSHNLHETSKAAALIKNKGTDTTCFVLEVCKRQGNNILCAICQV